MSQQRAEADLERFGLNRANMDGSGVGGEPQDSLFAHEQRQAHGGDLPWWQRMFFVREAVLFGTWDGVFTSVMVNIFGIIVFLRMGWIVVSRSAPLSFILSRSAVFTSASAGYGGCGEFDTATHHLRIIGPYPRPVGHRHLRALSDSERRRLLPRIACTWWSNRRRRRRPLLLRTSKQFLF